VSGVHVRVRVGGEQYALPVEHVHEIVELGEVTPVPGSAAGVLGLRNLDGEVLPVLDLARIIQIERDGRPGLLLVTEHRGRRAAFAVDEVIDVEHLAGTAQESESSYLPASTVIDGALVGVLEVGALLDTVLEEGGE
jgi:chemotaxis signal transduction protein